MYYYDTQDHYDHQVDAILHYLFHYEAPEIKKQKLQQVETLLNEMNISAMYLLFSLVNERLPQRAKYLFRGEDYKGKQLVLLEVMHQLTIN